MAEINYTKVKLTRIFRDDKQKNSKLPLISKEGNPYNKIAIQTEQYGEKWLSGFGNSANYFWRKGDIVEIEVTPNGEFLNFTNESTMLDRMLKAMEVRIMKLERSLNKKVEAGEAVGDVDFNKKETETIDPEDIPFN